MEMLIQNLGEERKRFSEQLQSERNAAKKQMDIIMAANLKKAQEELEALGKKNEKLKKEFEEMNQRNEENMKEIKRMSEKAAQKEKKAKERLQQLKDETFEDIEEVVKKTKDSSHKGQMKAAQDKAIQQARPEKGGTTGARIKERTKYAQKLHGQIEETRQGQIKVDEPGAFKKFCKFVAKAAPVVGTVASAVAPQFVPIVAPITAAVSAVAGLISECSIM